MNFLRHDDEAFLPLGFPEDSHFDPTDPATPANSGIMPIQWIRKLAQQGRIGGPMLDEGQFQPASLDLRIGRRAFRIHASFLPGRGSTVEERLERITNYSLDLSEPQILPKRQIYLVEIEEILSLPKEISGRANPKSSTGRLDIFTRIVADKVDVFDSIPPGYTGKLWAEVSSRTFDILLCRGVLLSQIRFRYKKGRDSRKLIGRLSDQKIERLHKRAALTDTTPIIRRGLNLRVNLASENGSDIIGYSAKEFTNYIDLTKVNYYPVEDFWDEVKPSRDGNIILSPDKFYILSSKENIHIPSDHAAEMVAIDPVMGEFRVHYAGFFDPGFGRSASHGPGAKAVLEVRTYDFPFFLEDGQPIGRLAFEALAAPPVVEYGTSISSNYQGQQLRLSKHFKMGG